MQFIKELVIELTKLKIQQCGHVDIANFSSNLLSKLLWSFEEGMRLRPEIIFKKNLETPCVVKGKHGYYLKCDPPDNEK